MEINKNTLKNYQFIVNYEKANLLHDELLNLIDKNITAANKIDSQYLNAQ